MTTMTNTKEVLGVILGGALCASVAVAQPDIGAQVRVNQDATSTPQNETTAASTDSAPERVLMAWNDYLIGNSKTGVGLSIDGGQTWATELLRPAPQFQTSTEGDPMTASDNRNGRMWAGGITFDSNGGMFVSRVEPGSTSFEPVVMAALNSVSPSGFIDKGWMAAGPDALDPSNPSKTMLYIAYNDGLISSSDLGDTWTNPLGFGFGLGFLPRVTPDGTLYILGWDFGFNISIWRSFNNGATIQGPFHVATRMDTWGADSSRFPGGFRVPELAHLAVDPNDGSLSVVYPDTTNIVSGNRNVDLYFTRSTDQGANWTTPVIVNQSDSSPPGDSFFPWIEADQNGRLHMVFHDSRNVAPQNDNASPGWFDAYYSYSDDAGATWNESRLTPSSFRSDQDGFGDGFLGDYHGIAAGGNTVYPLYVATSGANSADVFTHAITSNPCVADLAEPFGVLDFSDVVAFLTAFGSGDPAADLAPPAGVFDFSDVVAYLAAFGAGCP